MFTRTSNFTFGNYKISNIDTESCNNNFELIIHIKKYEEECLRMVLGECIYNDLMNNLELDDKGIYKLKDNAEEKWTWLIYGKTYDGISNNGCGCSHSPTSCKTHKWDGLVRIIGSIQGKEVFETLMSSYIFFHWSLNTRTLNLGTGEGRITAQNTTQESSKNKRIDAWNKLVQEVSFGYPNTRVSLYQFLNEHKEFFSDHQKICLNTLTYYDI